MAVVQKNKNKVRPVIDYRRLNEFVSSHSAEAGACGDKLKEWRGMGSNLAIVDLKSAYLQIHFAKDLWKYQVVRFHAQNYALTRLGFGLNVATKIMTAIVRKVLSMNIKTESATDSYIDYIIVNLQNFSVTEVVKQLSDYGLET